MSETAPITAREALEAVVRYYARRRGGTNELRPMTEQPEAMVSAMRAPAALSVQPAREGAPQKPYDRWKHPPGCPDGDYCRGNGTCFWRCEDRGDCEVCGADCAAANPPVLNCPRDSVQPAREGLRDPAQKASVWNDGRRAGIKWAISFLHDRAREMNDLGAKAALNVVASDLGRDAKAAAIRALASEKEGA